MGRKPSDGRRRLAADLRAACLDGSLRPGDPLPSSRELQAKYSVSPSVAVSVIAELVQEGLVRTIPRYGSFVADRVAAQEWVFVMTLGAPQPLQATPFIGRVQRGFEDRVARYGGSSLVLPLHEMRELVTAGTMPATAGVFLSTGDPDVSADWVVAPGSTTPVVRFWQQGSRPPDEQGCDSVHVNNLDGGRRATHHLARKGHRRIAFLGYDTSDGAWYHLWSDYRRQGWQEVMTGLEEPTDGMQFLGVAVDEAGEVEAIRAAAASLIPRRDITAVVCANDHAVIGLVAALRDHGVPPAGWPAIVGFDGRAEVDRHVVTSLRLPWEGLGAKAAELLYQRMTGELTGPGEQHLLPMEVVPRVGLTELAAALPVD